METIPRTIRCPPCPASAAPSGEDLGESQATNARWRLPAHTQVGWGRPIAGDHAAASRSCAISMCPRTGSRGAAMLNAQIVRGGGAARGMNRRSRPMNLVPDVTPVQGYAMIPDYDAEDSEHSLRWCGLVALLVSLTGD